MNGALLPLLWGGILGWFLLTYSLGLGGSKSAARVLIWTIFYWLIGLGCIAMLFSATGPLAQRFGVGWRFVSFVVVLPYVLCVPRLSWLRRRRRVPVAPGRWIDSDRSEVTAIGQLRPPPG